MIIYHMIQNYTLPAGFYFQQNLLDLKTHLYLLRDPRAVINSQGRNFRDFSWSDSAPAIYCDRLTRDLDSVGRLKQLYPGRVKVMRYEDGATYPHEYTAVIYGFLGLRLSNDVKDFVDFLTSGDDHYEYGHRRSDPTATMQKWRYNMYYERVALIDEHCGHLYPYLGYRKVESKTDLISNRTLVYNLGTWGSLQKL